MSERLKNTLAFANLAPEASVVLLHGLNTGVTGPRPLEPDIIFLPSPDLAVTDSNEFSITLMNQGPTVLSGAVLVEAWHTIERAFNGVQNVDLPVKPYVVVSAESNAQPPQPPFNPIEITIFARTTGNDTSGNGTLAKPYRTVQRATQDIPSNIPAGVAYIIDCTGIGLETFPKNYTFPAWKSAKTFAFISPPNPFFLFRGGVNINANPQLVAAIPAADCTIAASDVGPTTFDPVSGIATIHLLVPRASWTTANLQGKLVIGAGGGIQSNTIARVISTSAIEINATAGPFFPTFPITLMEQSAHFDGTSDVSPAPVGAFNVNNVDSLAFSGIKMTTPTVNGAGLVSDGAGVLTAQLCELQSPDLVGSFEIFPRAVACFLNGNVILSGSTFTLQSSLIANVTGLQLINLKDFSFRASSIIGCPPVEVTTRTPGSAPIGAASNGILDGVNIIGATGAAGFQFHGGDIKLVNTNISGSAGDGVIADAPGFLQLFKVGTSGPANGGPVGLFATNGVQVKVDTQTSTTLPGAGNGLRGAADTKVGTLATQTWAAFVGGGANTTDLNTFARLFT